MDPAIAPAVCASAYPSSWLAVRPVPRQRPRNQSAADTTGLKCGLLVLARDGDRTWLRPRSLGHATRFVLDHAPCRVLLVWPDEPPDLATMPPPPQRPTPTAQLKSDTALVNQLRNAIEAASDEDGWAALAYVGHILTKQSPDFDSRNYGYAKLSDLITATKLFELDRRDPGDGKPAVIHVRDKRRRADKKPGPPQ